MNVERTYSARTQKSMNYNLLCLYSETESIIVYRDALEVERTIDIFGWKKIHSVKRMMRKDIASIGIYSSKSYIFGWIFAMIACALFLTGAIMEMYEIMYIGLLFLIPVLQCLFYALKGYEGVTYLKITTSQNAGISAEIALLSNDANVIMDTLIPTHSDMVV